MLTICSLLVAANAMAGRPCTEFVPTPDTVKKALTLAQQTRTALDDSGAQVALIARVGQDLSKYHLRYSHFGYVWRDHPQGRWMVVHELNSCGKAESNIYLEGLGNFFLDDMFAYETLILIPGQETQQHLAALLAGNAPLAMHGLPYNMLAYPYSTQYQNSNQWGLELLAAASARDVDINSRAQAQAWLKTAGYQPGTVELDAMTRLGARMFRANIAFDDQPFDRRMAGHIDTVTVDSVFRFVEHREPENREIHLTLN
jgi:hypothetical protein